MEPRLHQRLQDHLDDRLRHAVGNGRNAERPRAAVVLRYLDEPHGRRMIRARRHPIPDLVQVTLQVLLEPRQGHPIHARSTAVRLHPLVRLPDELLGNVIRLCLRHRLLPSRVGQSLWRECRVPSLRPHYQASSLLRTRPSLRPASVLGSSRFRRLEVSLGIEAPGSHVPHKSLSLVSRRLHAGRRSASQQAPSELHPRPTTGAWFWRRPYAFDTSSTVQSHSSYQRTPDGFSPPFPQRSPPRPLCRGSLRWFGPRSCNPGPRGRPSSLVQQGCFEFGRVTSEPPLRAVVAHGRRVLHIAGNRQSHRRSRDRRGRSPFCSGGRTQSPLQILIRIAPRQFRNFPAKYVAGRSTALLDRALAALQLGEPWTRNLGD